MLEIAINKEKTPIVVIQCSLSNIEVARSSFPGIREMEAESEARFNLRHSREPIGHHADTVKNCCPSHFECDLENLGMDLVDAALQIRINPKNTRVNYAMVRFTFREKGSEISPEFLPVKRMMETNLRTFLSQALWQVRLFANPFFEEGKEIEGKQAISVNFEGRDPLFENGQQIMLWRTDASGTKLKDQPKTTKRGDCFLRAEDGFISVDSVEDTIKSLARKGFVNEAIRIGEIHEMDKPIEMVMNLIVESDEAKQGEANV